MIYYKITDKESDLYKKLYEQRTMELEVHKQNQVILAKLIPYKWDIYSGHRDNSFSRIPRYFGFKFENPEEVDMKVWKRDSNHPEIFIPNKRTKAGKEMQKAISNLKCFSFMKIMDILDIKDYCRHFAIPTLEIADDTVLVSVDDRHKLTQQDAIMITMDEFFNILRSAGFTIE